MNNKYIYIIILIFLGVIIFFYINKTSTKNTPPLSNVESIKNNKDLNTKTTNTQINDNKETNFSNTQTSEKNSNDYEYVTGKEMEDKILEWNTTRDPQLLIDSLNLSGLADNESFFEPWRLFLKTDSSQLLKLTDGSIEKKNLTQKIYFVFDWFIQISGEYNKLSENKKQQLSKEYQQLKIFLQ